MDLSPKVLHKRSNHTPRCEDAGALTVQLAIVNGVVTTLCKVGIVMLVTELVKKEVCYQLPDDERTKKVKTWEKKERVAMAVGALYVVRTSL